MGNKFKKVTKKETRENVLRAINMKAQEVMGMHISSKEAADGLVAVATSYNRVAEIDERQKETYINLGKAIVGALGMTSEIALHERDINTCLGLEQAYHSGATELKNIRKDFKPRRLLEK